MSGNVRTIALDLLIDIEKNKSYSNLALNKVMTENNLISQDAGLLTEIVYGTIQRKLTLDYYLQPFVQKKIDLWVRILLRMSVYQMVYLDKVPDHAIIHEAVEIAKEKGHAGIASFVNGVLRNLQRKGVLSVTDIKDPIEQLSIATSHPKWLVKLWTDQIGLENTKQICQLNLQPPVQTARVNLAKSTRERVVTLLEDEGYTVQLSDIFPQSIQNKRGNLAFSMAYQQGLITIQDESSMLVADVVSPQPNEVILDACAAPGGKTSHLLEKLNGTGKVVALDIHKHKIKLIHATATRLGLSALETRQLDARLAQENYPASSFDRILVDAPCSGLGVLRRKPEAKYEKTTEDIARLSAIQLNLLQQVSTLLKPGGTLVYSTCTINQSENEQVVKAFLQENAAFEKDFSIKDGLPEKISPFVKENYVQIFPHYFGSDGFFIASFKKRELV